MISMRPAAATQITAVRVSPVTCHWTPLLSQLSQFMLYDTSQPSGNILYMYVIQHSSFNQQTD